MQCNLANERSFDVTYCSSTSKCEGAPIIGPPVNETHKLWHHLRFLEDITRESEEGKHSSFLYFNIGYKSNQIKPIVYANNLTEFI
jgi:hypothetical protein